MAQSLPQFPQLGSTRSQETLTSKPVSLKRVFLLEVGSPTLPGAQGLSYLVGNQIFLPQLCRARSGQCCQRPEGLAAPSETSRGQEGRTSSAPAC